MAMKTMSKTARTTTNAKEDEHDANEKKKTIYVDKSDNDEHDAIDDYDENKAL